MVLGWFSKRDNSPKKARSAIPTVQFDASRVTMAIQTDQRIQEFEDLPVGKERTVFQAAVLMAQRGGDLHHLAKTLEDLSIAKSRAAYIARYLGKRSSSLMNIAKMRDTGIAQGKWLYSGASCYAQSPPTPADLAMDAAHKSAANKRFPLDKGICLNGIWTFPGLEPGCKCAASAVVPGFD